MDNALLALTLDAGAVALTIMVPLVALAVRASRGERWEVPLTWSPELEGILPSPDGQGHQPTPYRQAAD